MRKSSTLLLLIILSTLATRSSAQGTLTGDLQANVNFYQGADSLTSAQNDVFYNKKLSGGESWLALRYNYKGFTAFARIDAYQNSALYDPKQAVTAYGIGAYSLSKEIGELTVTGGYIYDQIGSGMLFRAYEDRGLLIDNALVGLHVKYKPFDNVTIKAFAGQQKNVYTITGRYQPIIKGFNAEGDFNVGKKVHVSPGIGILDRTLDDASMDGVVSYINSHPLETRFEPRYNTYGFTGYNTLTVGGFSWYAEGAYKTHEAIFTTATTLEDKAGNSEYTTIGYARKGIAINLTGKRVENFVMRTSPNETLLRGVINWQPVVARIRPQRLISRYSPASQDVSEQALGADVLVSPKENLDFTFNYTYINTLNDLKLYREVYGEAEYRGIKKVILIGGMQYLNYNLAFYQQHTGMLIAYTPFAELTYRITPKKSLRVELEYQSTKQDYGSWAFALIEYNIAPRWSFSVSDMFITKLNPDNPAGFKQSDLSHYYNVFTSYTKGPHRFSLSYVKQVAGINCTGGVCRFEPAFAGVKFGLTTSF